MFVMIAVEEEPADQIDLSCFSGNLRRDDHDNARDCWNVSDGGNFRVRSKHFCYDKSKVLLYWPIPIWFLIFVDHHLLIMTFRLSLITLLAMSL